MPRTKQSIGKKYGIVLAKRYLATQQGDAETAEKMLKQRDKLQAEINSLIAAEEITPEELAEVTDYIAAIETMEAYKMAFNAFCMQAVAYAMKAARNLDIVKTNEKLHSAVYARPLLIFGADDAGLLDAEDETIPLRAYVDLEAINAEEDPEGFIAALKQNDIAGRYYAFGATATVDDGRPAATKEMMLKQQTLDRGGEVSYNGLFEIEEPVLRDFISESRTQLIRSLYYVDYYLFAAEVIEAFFNLDGLAEALAEEIMLNTSAVAGYETYNIAVGGINEALINRYMPGEDPITAGKEYVDTMLAKAREEWLQPVEWEHVRHPKEAKAVAREMTAEDLSTVGRLAVFLNAQRKKRGMA